MRGLYLGESASSTKYELLPKAFLLHEQNLRRNALNKLFAMLEYPMLGHGLLIIEKSNLLNKNL